MLNDETFDRLAHLCRIALNQEEKEKLQSNLKNILVYIESLQTVNTTGVTPCAHVIEALPLSLRADEEGPLLTQEAFFANAPKNARVGGMIKVPAVMKPEE